MNPLEDSPKARKIAYQVFWVLSLIVGATQVGFAAAQAGTPTWLTVTLSVLPFVGAAIGYTAQANVVTREVVPRHAGNPERGAVDTSILMTIALILVIIVCLVWIFQNLG